ncbi:Uncharacterised protein [Vibrio cholerae]|nr:Uncharacterised protein [Vibrio cholerae]
MASTAIPTVNTIPAIPGKVMVAPGIIDITPMINTRFAISAMLAIMPNLR